MLMQITINLHLLILKFILLEILLNNIMFMFDYNKADNNLSKKINEHKYNYDKISYRKIDITGIAGIALIGYMYHNSAISKIKNLTDFNLISVDKIINEYI